MTWETSGAAILAQVLGSSTATAADTTWAGLCAAAVNAAAETGLNGYVPAAASNAEAELARAVLLDGIAAYKDRDAPAGVMSVGPDGAPVRLRPDTLRAAWPVIRRYAPPGIG